MSGRSHQRVLPHVLPPGLELPLRHVSRRFALGDTGQGVRCEERGTIMRRYYDQRRLYQSSESDQAASDRVDHSLEAVVRAELLIHVVQMIAKGLR